MPDHTTRTGALGITGTPWTWRPGSDGFTTSAASSALCPFEFESPQFWFWCPRALEWGKFLALDTAMHVLYFISINTALNLQVTCFLCLCPVGRNPACTCDESVRERVRSVATY